MKTNHQRGFKAGKSLRDKSMQSWRARLPSGHGMASSESLPNDFVCGHRGMARSVRGAKKRVRTLVRRDAKRHIIDQLSEG